MSTREEVKSLINRDIVLREGLSRGVLKHKAAATWLKMNRNVDGSIEEIASAVREYDVPSGGSRFQQAWDTLENIVIRRSILVSVIRLRNHERVYELLPTLFESLDPGDGREPRFLPSTNHYTIIVPKKHKGDVLDLVENEDWVLNPPKQYRELVLEPKHADRLDAAPLSLLVTALTSHGISVWQTFNAVNQFFIMIDDDDYEKALTAVDLLGTG